MSPSVFVSTLWRKTFELIGVDYSGVFFENDTDFLSEVITPSFGILKTDSGTTENLQGVAYIANNEIFQTSQTEINIENRLSLTGYNASAGATTIPTTGTYRINADFNHEITSGRFI
ncbi:hypothetical protein SAMN05192545_0017 [Maribacter dokdonensis]|uniref:Uncharacterized protein n=1 Tax=Maribacter dokdonensis TaxID=320912 RepID=A0ABY0TXY4_9FLAO|nr:hypothetical protein SAMN05192545_0017 [Maribacter dokdonensis]